MSTMFKTVLAIIAAVLAFAGFVFGVNRSKKVKKYTPKPVRKFCLKTEQKTIDVSKKAYDKSKDKVSSAKSNLDSYFDKQKSKKAAK